MISWGILLGPAFAGVFKPFLPSPQIVKHDRWANARVDVGCLNRGGGNSGIRLLIIRSSPGIKDIGVPQSVDFLIIPDPRQDDVGIGLFILTSI